MAHSIIIGGTKGLGRVVARQFAQRGDVVSVLGRNEIPAADLEYGDIRSYQADITDQQTLLPVLDKAIAKGGKLNYCVFLQRYRGKDDPWAGELQTTLTATKVVLEHLVPSFSEEEDKGVVMVSSVFGHYVGEGQPISYHVAKAGLDQMMRFYALNLGGQGIRVNGITPFTFLKEESRSFYTNNQSLTDLYESVIPLKRMATTEDSANVVTYLCSPLASFVTGQNIFVDGGVSLIWPETLARRLAGV